MTGKSGWFLTELTEFTDGGKSIERAQRDHVWTLEEIFGLLESGIELNFHLNVSDHDYGVKMRRAEESLANEVTVKLQLKFRGSEMAREEEGISLIRRMIADLSGMGIVDVEPRWMGKSIKLALSPLPPDKRVRKFVS